MRLHTGAVRTLEESLHWSWLGENPYQHRGLQPPYILGIEWWNVWRFRGKRLSHCVRQNEVCSFSAACNLCHPQRLKGLANFGFILLVCYMCIIITAKTQRLLLRWCVAYLFALLSFLYASIHSIFTCIISLFWSNKASFDRHVDALLLALLYASFHSIFTCASFLLSCIHS